MTTRRRPSDAARSPAVAVTELDLEQVVERLARLILHAHALAERYGGDGGAVDCVARDERVRRLRAAADLGQRAIQAAVGYAALPGDSAAVVGLPEGPLRTPPYSGR